MNLKSFAQTSRTVLMEGVVRRLAYWGFRPDGATGDEPQKVAGGYIMRGDVFDDAVVPERWSALKRAISAKGFEEVVEEAAYTWFNRMVAMQVLAKNDYEIAQLEFAKDDDTTPLMLQRARRGDMAFLDAEEQSRVAKLLATFTKDQEAFAQLLTGYCRSHRTLSRVFGKPDDYTELLLPDDMLQEGGFLHLLNTAEALTDEEFQKVELIGWLYQFYISEKKDEVFDSFGKGKKAEAKDIPAATQIFTPNWIVKYMVENTAGKVWLDKHPNSPLKDEMKYLVENESDGTREPIIKDVEELTLIDPACGSGHILVEGFDLLYKMHMERYYSPEDAVDSILKHNLFGLDIDDRAAQLATFAVLLKAAQCDRKVWSRDVLPNVHSMPEKRPFGMQELKDFLGKDGVKHATELEVCLMSMQDAKNRGSVMKLKLSSEAHDFVSQRFNELKAASYRDFNEEAVLKDILPFIPVLLALTRKFTSVVANPPYLGQRSLNSELKKYLSNHYPYSKKDLFSVFQEVLISLGMKHGLNGAIVPPSWLFLSSFEDFRELILHSGQIDSLLYMARGVFGGDWGSVALVQRKSKADMRGSYFRLINRTFQEIKPSDLETLFLLSKANPDYKFDFTNYRDGNFTKDVSVNGDIGGQKICYPNVSSATFLSIPGSPIAFWVPPEIINGFSQYDCFGDVAPGKVGMQTAKNDFFLRRWFEISRADFGVNRRKWLPYLKGGEYRKWFGNLDFVVRYYEDGSLLREQKNATICDEEILKLPKCTWSDVASGDFHCRMAPAWSFYDIKGHCFYPTLDNQFHLLAWANSNLFNSVMKFINPSLSFQVGDFNKIPVPSGVLEDADLAALAEANVRLTKADWNSRELSWDFQQSPLLFYITTSLKESLKAWEDQAFKDFNELKKNEEEINARCISHFNPELIFSNKVLDSDSSILRLELELPGLGQSSKGESGQDKVLKHDEVMRQFVSYCAGLMMGRYRLDKPGLNIAHPNPSAEELSSYEHNGHRIEIDDDAILPLMGSDCQFPDDVLHRMQGLLDAIWGGETRTANLNFLQACLGKDLEKYLVKDFFKDHCKRYKKKPIYWLFSSPKGAFQVLAYMHRMNAFTVEKIRSNYLLEHLRHLRQEEQLLAGNEAGLSSQDGKRLDQLRKDIADCEAYDLELKDVADAQISFDLDAGVTENHTLFGKVVAKIK